MVFKRVFIFHKLNFIKKKDPSTRTCLSNILIVLRTLSPNSPRFQPTLTCLRQIEIQLFDFGIVYVRVRFAPELPSPCGHKYRAPLPSALHSKLLPARFNRTQTRSYLIYSFPRTPSTFPTIIYIYIVVIVRGAVRRAVERERERVDGTN